jgi:hypothetical protein
MGNRDFVVPGACDAMGNRVSAVPAVPWSCNQWHPCELFDLFDWMEDFDHDCCLEKVTMKQFIDETQDMRMSRRARAGPWSSTIARICPAWVRNIGMA